MNKIFVILMLAALSCTACLRQDEFQGLDSYLQSGALRAEYGKPTMRLSVGKKLLWLARLVGPADKDFTELVSHVNSVSIVTYRLNGNPEPALNAIRNATMELKAHDWEPIVSVSGEDEQTQILVKLSDDTIRGMVIMSMEPGDEAVFINISGEITPGLAGKITRGMDVDVNI